MFLGVISYVRVIIRMLSKNPSPSGRHAGGGEPLDEGCESDETSTFSRASSIQAAVIILFFWPDMLRAYEVFQYLKTREAHVSAERAMLEIYPFFSVILSAAVAGLTLCRVLIRYHFSEVRKENNPNNA
jgi:hypothetical protein